MESKSKKCRNPDWHRRNPERSRFHKKLYKERHPERVKAIYRAQYLKHREKRLAQATARHRKLKAEVFAAYGGYVCACCSEDIEQFLCIDHVENNGYRHRKEVGWSVNLYSWLKKNGFPIGFQVLCFNCNQGKRLNGGVCPHNAAVRDRDSGGLK